MACSRTLRNNFSATGDCSGPDLEREFVNRRIADKRTALDALALVEVLCRISTSERPAFFLEDGGGIRDLLICGSVEHHRFLNRSSLHRLACSHGREQRHVGGAGS
ncbi:hypothetical protein BRAS3843_680022 [Bradyrhizobium sp. STM 3843]|nr:hypothetical protein BRAS3843_680022 [Bradyrhizobium sp. STM 3843]